MTVSVALVENGVLTGLTCSVPIAGAVVANQVFTCSGTAAVTLTAGDPVALGVTASGPLAGSFMFGVGTRCQ